MNNVIKSFAKNTKIVKFPEPPTFSKFKKQQVFNISADDYCLIQPSIIKPGEYTISLVMEGKLTQSLPGDERNYILAIRKLLEIWKKEEF